MGANSVRWALKREPCYVWKQKRLDGPVSGHSPWAQQISGIYEIIFFKYAKLLTH
jgi:hypothetical protein